MDLTFDLIVIQFLPLPNLAFLISLQMHLWKQSQETTNACKQRKEMFWLVDIGILVHLLGNYSTAILVFTSVIFVNMVSQSYSNPGYTSKIE